MSTIATRRMIVCVRPLSRERSHDPSQVAMNETWYHLDDPHHHAARSMMVRIVAIMRTNGTMERRRDIVPNYDRCKTAMVAPIKRLITIVSTISDTIVVWPSNISFTATVLGSKILQ